MNIVVIDDEFGTRESIIRLIRKINPDYKVIGEADNGYDGMLLIKSLHPNLVISDIMMPRLSGLEMIENARACSPQTKFIILSGYAEFDLAKQAIQLAVVDYLLKPITVEQLTNVLNKVNGELKLKLDTENTKTEAAKYSPIVQFIVNGICRDYANKIYLDEYAKEIKVTPEYAGSLFSKETGKSFCMFLRDVRMEKAIELIKSSDDKIYEIAYKTGYSDVKYFCRVFKEYTGTSPKSYSRLQ